MSNLKYTFVPGMKVVYAPQKERWSAAKKGATAVVAGFPCNMWLPVKWEKDNPLHFKQMDGEYHFEDFVPLEAPLALEDFL